MRRDVVYALRLLWRNPGFALTAILSMAFGIAICTAVFSIVNAVLLRPLPVPRPDALVSIYSLYSASPGFEGPTGLRAMSWPDCQDLAARRDLFQSTSGFVLLPANLDAAGETDQVLAEFATGAHHQTLGLRAAAGRLLTPDDDRPGAPPVVVISHQLWRDRFASNPAAVGSTIRLNGRPFDIVGILPEAFKSVLLDWGVPGLTVPLAQQPQVWPTLFGEKVRTSRDAAFLMMIARLRDGVTLEAASAALRVQAARMSADVPSRRDAFSLSLYPTNRTRFWPERRASAIDFATVLIASVVIVLAIAVLNVANLLIARLASRQREISVRLALGASRASLVRQLAVEGLTLAMAGAIVSAPLATLLTRAIAGVHLPFFIKNAGLSLTPDWRVLAAMAALCGVCGLLLGLLPALRAWRTDLRTAMTNVPGTRRRGLARLDLRHALAAAQVAICLVLAIAAGLMGKSLTGLLRADLGFETRNATLLPLSAGTIAYTPARGRALQQALLDRVRALPGVEAAAFARDALPSQVRANRTVTAASAIEPAARAPQVLAWNVVSPGYFETLRMPIVSGRAFQASDDETSAPVAIVNETAARRFWQDPARAIGQTIQLADERAARTIVGVSRDAVYREVGEAPRPFLFIASGQHWIPTAVLHVRASHAAPAASNAAIVSSARRELRLLDPALSFEEVRTFDDFLAFRMAAPRLAAGLAIGCGLAGLALALFGLYAVLAYLVAQRRRELAIRLAIGATPRQVMAFVSGFGLRVTLAGLAIGLLVMCAIARRLAPQLQHVDPYDPAIYAAVVMLVFLAAAAACLLPARRAARLEPWRILRRS